MASAYHGGGPVSGQVGSAARLLQAVWPGVNVALQQEAASIMHHNDDVLGLTVPLVNLALLATRQGREDRAHTYCHEALAMLRPLDEHLMVAHILEIVATAKWDALAHAS